MLILSKVIMLAGLPASGKSTYAKELSEKENAIILSSDDLRVELYGDVNHQDNNGELFQELYRRARQHLSSGQNVIIDATNISSKRRIHFINEFKQFEKECVYVSTLYDNCLFNDKKRERTVGKHVIDRMYKQLQIPFIEEGWDKVIYHHSNLFRSSVNYLEEMIKNKASYDEMSTMFYASTAFRPIYELPHDSTYHSLSVSRHTYHVWEYVLDNYYGDDKLTMLWVALLHDVGKAFCKEFRDGKRYASFIGHENVSAQIAMNYLHQLGYDIDFIIEVAKIVQNHMRLLNGGDKAEEKIQSMYGEDVLNKLKFFREADTQAH